MSQLDDINSGFKSRSKRASATLSSRNDLDELRIKHVISSGQRKPIDFAKLSEKVSATLEVAQAISAKTSGIRKHFKGTNSLGHFDELRNQLKSLVAVLQTLKLKLA
jgi:hypothetical protein